MHHIILARNTLFLVRQLTRLQVPGLRHHGPMSRRMSSSNGRTPGNGNAAAQAPCARPKWLKCVRGAPTPSRSLLPPTTRPERFAQPVACCRGSACRSNGGSRKPRLMTDAARRCGCRCGSNRVPRSSSSSANSQAHRCVVVMCCWIFVGCSKV